MTAIYTRMLDRELKKGSAELLILALVEARCGLSIVLFCYFVGLRSNSTSCAGNSISAGPRHVSVAASSRRRMASWEFGSIARIVVS